jgi:hypothetical protein
MATSQPCPARATAVALPIPRVAPVTNARRRWVPDGIIEVYQTVAAVVLRVRWVW